jgi:hypothetical protein
MENGDNELKLRSRESLRLCVNCTKIFISILLVSSFSVTGFGYENYVAATTETVSEGQDSELVPYENSTFGVYLQYPDNWEVVTPSNTRNGTTFPIVEFWSPDGTGVISVNRDIFDINHSMDTYLAEIIQYYKNIISNFTLISSDTFYTTLAGNPAYALLYSENEDETGLMFLTKEIGTIIGDTDMVYYVVYNAPIGYYANNEQIANQIIDSLEIHIRVPNVDQNQPPDLELEETLEGVGEI